jgi:sporulation protein YlmC with PRC-barrel domain
MDSFVYKASSYDETLDARSVIGLRVLTKSGVTFGKVKRVRLNPKTRDFEGVVIARPLNPDAYVCSTYIERITPEAFLLSIEPASLCVGKTVVSSDGKKIGVVKMVVRATQSNDIDSFFINRGWFRKGRIEFTDVKQIGISILLNKTYEQIKRDFKS